MKLFYHTITIVFCLFLLVSGYAQQCTVKFTGRDRTNQYRVKLDRVEIFNLDQLWEEVIYWPDTTLMMGTVGVEDYETLTSVQLMRNVPNPFNGRTEFALILPEGRDVRLEIFDMNGRCMVGEEFSALPAGTHLFEATMTSPQTYLLSATVKDGRMTLKMINEGHGEANAIRYMGVTDLDGDFTVYLKNDRATGSYPFQVGDKMQYIGYATIDGVERESATVTKSQTNNETIPLLFDVTAPSVTTLNIVTVTGHTATINSQVTDDGGVNVTQRGLCWSASQNPTIYNSHTIDGIGIGDYTSSLTELTSGTTYYVRAYATNSVGTAYGEESSFTTLSESGDGVVIDDKSCSVTPTVADHEGNVYATVQIGNQCWMRDNLRTTTSPSTGTYLIPALGTGLTYTGKQAFWYNNDSATYSPRNHGLLYNWNAAVDTFNTAYGETSVVQGFSTSVSASFTGFRRGICPAGWHLPSDAEWTAMTNYVRSQSNYLCGSNNSYFAKALASTEDWNSYSGECVPGNQSVAANNATGFSAVPAGQCSGSIFYYDGYYANFWSSTQVGVDNAYNCFLTGANACVFASILDKPFGLSVRCLRDESGDNDSTTTALIDEKSCPAAPTLTDYDGNIYSTVQIGEQCWMRENLRTTHYANGTSIAMGSDTSIVTAYRYCPDNTPSNVIPYGYLYNYIAVMGSSTSSSANPSGVQGICPTGWHVPSNTEWAQLADYISTQSQYICDNSGYYIAKSLASATEWNSSIDLCAVGNNQSANNATGFNALPAGSFSSSGYNDIHERISFWSSWEISDTWAFGRGLYYSAASLSSSSGVKSNGRSVRCVKD